MPIAIDLRSDLVVSKRQEHSRSSQTRCGLELLGRIMKPEQFWQNDNSNNTVDNFLKLFRVFFQRGKV